MEKSFIALLLLVGSFNSFSQTTSFGVNAGLGKTWNANLYTNYENRFFIFHTYGVSFLRSTTPHFAYGIDLNYSFAGANLYMQLGGDIPQSYNLKTRVQFLRLPFKAHYFFGKPAGVIRPNVYLAPTAGYLLHARDVGEINHPVGTEHYNDNTSKKYNRRIDYGIQGGAGLNFRLSNTTTLNTNANYYHGFPNTWGTGRRNRNASINVGVAWSLNRY